MARDLTTSIKPIMGVLQQPCHTCKNTWGYVDTTAPSIDPYVLTNGRRRFDRIVVCGLCGREQKEVNSASRD